MSTQEFSPDEISEWFWEIVARSQTDRAKLAAILETLSKDELVRFEDEFEEAAAQLRDEPFARFIDEEASEDMVQDVASFVVSQGKHYYANVWSNPEVIPAQVDAGDPRILSGVADGVHWRRFNRGIWIDPNRPFRKYV